MIPASITSRRRIVTNVAANWLGFAAAVVVTFFMSPLLVHALGDRDYGVWALVDSVLAYLALFDLGIGAAFVRYAARFRRLERMTNWIGCSARAWRYLPAWDWWHLQSRWYWHLDGHVPWGFPRMSLLLPGGSWCCWD